MQMRPLTRAEVRSIDQRAVAVFGMSSLVLMENAGRNAAMIIAERWPVSTSVCILVGKGNNSGDGFVIARHLELAGFKPLIVMTQSPSLFSADTSTNHAIAVNSELQIRFIDPVEESTELDDVLRQHELIIDGLLGTGLQGAAREPIASAIGSVQSAVAHRTGQGSVCQVVAIDVPSGMDCDCGTVAVTDNGTPLGITADLTITFVAPKVGFLGGGARGHLGEVVVADIGAPAVLLREYAAAKS